LSKPQKINSKKYHQSVGAQQRCIMQSLQIANLPRPTATVLMSVALWLRPGS